MTAIALNALKPDSQKRTPFLFHDQVSMLQKFPVQQLNVLSETSSESLQKLHSIQQANVLKTGWIVTYSTLKSTSQS